MPFEHLDAERFEIVDRARIRIAARDGDSTPRQQLSERAHTGAGNANEMNRARVGVGHYLYVKRGKRRVLSACCRIPGEESGWRCQQLRSAAHDRALSVAFA